jgi:hypothetical protein
MVELPTFNIWFNTIVANAMAIVEEMFEDVVSISNPPLDFAIGYRSMYALGITCKWQVQSHIYQH